MRSRKAFTLIELLVVVAIIALLMAILLPSLSSARRQARVVACASNYKQILVALHMYTEENTQRLPIPISEMRAIYQYTAINLVNPHEHNKVLYSGYHHNFVSLGLLHPYLPGTNLVDGNGNFNLLNDGEPFSKRKVLSCVEPKMSEINANVWTLSWASVSYYGWRQVHAFTKRPSINESAIAMVGGWVDFDSMVQASLPDVIGNHNNTGDNIGFLDGHVRFMTNREMQIRKLTATRDTDGSDPYGADFRAIFNVP